jgi:hypothetical protein
MLLSPACRSASASALSLSRFCVSKSLDPSTVINRLMRRPLPMGRRWQISTG